MAPLTLEDAFVNVSFDEEEGGESSPQESMYKKWIKNSSAQREAPDLFGADALRKLHPEHSLVMSNYINLLGFPGALVQPFEVPEMISNVIFIPLKRKFGENAGVLVENVEFGAFRIAWDQFDFTLYTVKFQRGFGTYTQHYLLHKGSKTPSQRLLAAAGAWSYQVHQEIWVFNQGYWYKDGNLWQEVQKADWKDVILNPDYKKALRNDVYGFFNSEKIYKDLEIPWKRGFIMHGPPGNGKTISIKAIMRDCDAKGHVPLYVKSFKSWMGEEASMALCFDKARELAPCVLVLEDLDSLINDANRSFFLNQLDGLEGNDGILVIGTTNHLERLDPALSTRPSRFDRKYLFDDPDRDERAQYVKYWQNKLSGNKAIYFPDTLVDDIAEMTDNFSFAFLKEAFVSTLVLIATAAEDGTKLEFEPTMKKTIQSLRKQIEKPQDVLASTIGMPRLFGPRASNAVAAAATLSRAGAVQATPLPPKPDDQQDLIVKGRAAVAMGRSFVC